MKAILINAVLDSDEDRASQNPWNFQHLVNLRREAGFNSVNILLGYPSVRIVSPLELIYGDEEEI